MVLPIVTRNVYFIDRADRGCKHIAAALFQLLETVGNSEMETCTSKVCTWVRKGKRNEGCLPVCQLDVERPEYGKLMTKRPSMSDFQPMTTSYNKTGLIVQFQKELSNVYRDAVVLKYPPESTHASTTESDLTRFISDNNNVAKEEIVVCVCIYSMLDYATNFASKNGLSKDRDISVSLAEEFRNSVNITEEHIETINQQTRKQSQSSFWFEQRAGRVTASSFYTVCHLRDSTDRRNTVKYLMNYCPLNNDSAPEQLVWGHEKEAVAIQLYVRKVLKKHKAVSVEKSGLIVSNSMPFLGASPDRIRICKCCPHKTIVEVKSLYAKRNFLPAVAAATYLEKDNKGNLMLKSETKWNYQIQGLMGISGIHNAELVIYTNKGILIIPVSFDIDLWNVIKHKVRAFYAQYMVEELLTKKIYKSL